MNNWISVKDRLPENEYIHNKVAIYPVIIAKNKTMSFCRFYKDHYKTRKSEFVCERNGKITKVLKWHPLPEPPRDTP